ncbi:DUF3291 domain-containing protein [Leptothrix sp. BB-4]
MPAFHLAQINIARAKAEMDSDVMRDFVARLDEINGLAEQAPGFVWRLKDEANDATAIRVFDDPLMLVNMSVWRDLESLKAFVYRSMHVELIRDRDAWFNKMTAAHQALWWIPAGHVPDTQEAKARLELLRTQGPTAEAFTFAKAFAAPSA